MAMAWRVARITRTLNLGIGIVILRSMMASNSGTYRPIAEGEKGLCLPSVILQGTRAPRDRISGQPTTKDPPSSAQFPPFEGVGIEDGLPSSEEIEAGNLGNQRGPVDSRELTEVAGTKTV